MTNGRTEKIVAMMLAQLPQDGSNIGNGALIDAMRAAGLGSGLEPTDDEFHEARDRLIAAGLAKKGRGRGGSTAQVLGAHEGRPADWAGPAAANATQPHDTDRPDFALQGEVVPAELPFNPPKTARKSAARPQAGAAPGDPQVLAYRQDRKSVV